MLFIICCLLVLQFIVLFALSLPSCLSPILIVGILKLGASMIPDEEFPITNSQFFNRLR